MSSFGRGFWRLRLARWPSAAGPVGSSPGYALVVPVPGDLPVFTHLALASCVRQSALDRVETIVVPDRRDPRVSALVEQARRTWPGPLRELLIRRPERQLLPRLGNAGRNHGFQIVTAVAATTASHVVLHDADLFLLDPGAHDRQYGEAVARDLDVLGVSPAWDEWFEARGRSLAATWEMVARVDWLRRFPPWRLLGHETDVLGERHVLDTSFFAQLHTDPARIAVHDGTGGLVHFNYLISQYRLFLRATTTYVDHHAVLLVIRVLSDLFLPAAAVPELPDVETLRRALTDVRGRVSYDGVTPAEYARNRALLTQVLGGPWADEALRAAAGATLAPFDEHFGWQEPPPGAAAAPAGVSTGAPTGVSTGAPARVPTGVSTGASTEEPAAVSTRVPTADVTVVVPVKDRGPLLRETLSAVLAQVPAPAAVVVVDDGSGDDSAAVAAASGATVLRHEHSRGAGAARNTGLAVATTGWVAFCDSDDLWLPGHLAGLLRAAGDHVLVTAPARTTTGRWRGNARGRDVALDPTSLLVPGEGLCASATMVRRSQALAVGGFPEIALAEDLGLWLRLLDVGTGVETAHPTVLYREHPGQISVDAPMRRAFTDVVEAFAGRPWLTPGLRTRAESRLIWDDLRAAQRAGDAAGVRAALRWYAGHPAGLPPLAALLRDRRRGRLAARRLPLDLAAPEPSDQPGDRAAVPEPDVVPTG